MLVFLEINALDLAQSGPAKAGYFLHENVIRVVNNPIPCQRPSRLFRLGGIVRSQVKEIVIGSRVN